MKSNKQKSFESYAKDLYRISKERLEVYLVSLDEASNILHDEIKPKSQKDKEKIHEAWGKIIDVLNSLSGFKVLEDDEVCGTESDDMYLFNWPWTRLDNLKFHDIEFAKKKGK